MLRVAGYTTEYDKIQICTCFSFVGIISCFLFLAAKNNKYVWPKGTDLFNNSFEMAYGFFAARGIGNPAPQPPPQVLSSPVQGVSTRILI
jgi:hypothetical protein